MYGGARNVSENCRQFFTHTALMVVVIESFITNRVNNCARSANMQMWNAFCISIDHDFLDYQDFALKSLIFRTKGATTQIHFHYNIGIVCLNQVL